MGRLWLLLLTLIGGQPPKLVRTPKRPAPRVVDAATHDTVRNATADEARRRLAAQRGGGRTDVYRPAPGNIYTFAPTASQTQEPTRDMERMPPPLLMPPSGAYDLAVGASLLHEIPGTKLHCTIEGVDCPLSPTGDECAPTRASPSYMAGTIIHLSGTMSPTITIRCMARAPSGRFSRIFKERTGATTPRLRSKSENI